MNLHCNEQIDFDELERFVRVKKALENYMLEEITDIELDDIPKPNLIPDFPGVEKATSVINPSKSAHPTQSAPYVRMGRSPVVSNV